MHFTDGFNEVLRKYYSKNILNMMKLTCAVGNFRNCILFSYGQCKIERKSNNDYGRYMRSIQLINLPIFSFDRNRKSYGIKYRPIITIINSYSIAL